MISEHNAKIVLDENRRTEKKKKELNHMNTSDFLFAGIGYVCTWNRNGMANGMNIYNIIYVFAVYWSTKSQAQAMEEIERYRYAIKICAMHASQAVAIEKFYHHQCERAGDANTVVGDADGNQWWQKIDDDK